VSNYHFPYKYKLDRDTLTSLHVIMPIWHCYVVKNI